MNIWLVKDGEPIPCLESDARKMRTANMCEFLGGKGNEVLWWTSSWSHYGKKRYKASKNIVKVTNNYSVSVMKGFGYKKNISISRLLHYSLLAMKLYFKARKCKKPDIIICSLPSVEFAYVCGKIASKYGCLCLLDLRDMWPDIFVMNAPPKLKGLVRFLFSYQFRMMKSATKNATGFIGITDRYLKWACEYANRPISKNDIVLPLVSENFKVNSGVNVNNIKLSEIKREGSFNIVYAGNLSLTSVNIIPIMKLFLDLPDNIQLLMAGSTCGDSALEEQYLELAKKIPNIHYLGWLNREELNQLYQMSDVALAPYSIKGYFSMNLTNKPIEYMGYGLPVLTTGESYLTSFIIKNNVGLIYSLGCQDDSFINTILKLYNDEKYLLSLKNNCLLVHKRDFDYTEVMDRFYSFLNLINSKSTNNTA